MQEFKKEWTLETAMKILGHPTVDSAIWSSAVEWLLVYGPPEIQKLIQDASMVATAQNFPNLQATGFTAEGQPCYSVTDLATALGIEEEEAEQILKEKQEKHGTHHLYGADHTLPQQ